MQTLRFSRLVMLVLAVIGLAAGAGAQSRPPIGNLKVVVVPARATYHLDGAGLYEAYCASCHGKDLKGYGPAGWFTRVQPIDLTISHAGHTTERDGAMHIAASLGEVHSVPASKSMDQTTLDMPDWLPLFKAMSRMSQAEAALRIANVSNYIASLQRVEVPETILAKK